MADDGLETPSTQAQRWKQLEKVTTWWNSQPDESAKTIQRASVAMGIDACKLKNSSTDEIVLKVMTVAMLMNS
jgi:hypothetical protein